MKFTKAEIDAIVEASPRTFVPFNKLVLSQDYQARAGGSTPKLSIAELAASIKECDVLPVSYTHLTLPTSDLV